MKNLVYLLPLTLFACGSPATEQTPETAKDYKPETPGVVQIEGLLGSWKDVLNSDTTEFHENWESGDDEIAVGLGYVLAGTDTVMIEDLRISVINEEIIYNARVRSQNMNEWVQFLLMPSGADTLKFYNPQHDFPQEILYVKDNEAWNVRISNESGQMSEFRLEPYQEEGA